MAKNSNNKKVAIYVEVFPREKKAFEEWIEGRFHSVADAVRDHIRKVTGLNQKSQEKSGPGKPAKAL